MSNELPTGYHALIAISQARTKADGIWAAYVAEKKANGLSARAEELSVMWALANDEYQRLNEQYRHNLPSSQKKGGKKG